MKVKTESDWEEHTRCDKLTYWREYEIGENISGANNSHLFVKNGNRWEFVLGVAKENLIYYT